jgi:hypothetical protein
VEKEAGKFGRVVAAVTSLLALSLARLIGGPVVLWSCFLLSAFQISAFQDVRMSVCQRFSVSAFA